MYFRRSKRQNLIRRLIYCCCFPSKSARPLAAREGDNFPRRGWCVVRTGWAEGSRTFSARPVLVVGEGAAGEGADSVVRGSIPDSTPVTSRAGTPAPGTPASWRSWWSSRPVASRVRRPFAAVFSRVRDYERYDDTSLPWFFSFIYFSSRCSRL